MMDVKHRFIAEPNLTKQSDGLGDSSYATISVPLTLRPSGQTIKHMLESDHIYAVNAALASGRPLLVLGEPGVGKTQLARAVAKKLERAFVSFTLDAHSESHDLMWHFDAVGRLAEAQIRGAISANDDTEAEKKKLQQELAVSHFLQPRPLWWAFDPESARAQLKKQNSLQVAPEQLDGGKWDNGVVLLLDEIDKADTQVPNGLLEALGSLQFTAPGGRTIRCNAKQGGNKKNLPLVIITSNAERALPPAFIRRCWVLTLALPSDPEDLEAYLTERGGKHFPDIAVDVRRQAAKQVVEDRGVVAKAGLKPLPGQAEYLDLLCVLNELYQDDKEKQQKKIAELAKFITRKAQAVQG